LGQLVAGGNVLMTAAGGGEGGRGFRWQCIQLCELGLLKSHCLCSTPRVGVKSSACLVVNN